MSLQDIMNPAEDAPLPPATSAPVPEEPPKEQKAPMRSWRKKYRKLNLRFQKVMEDSNQLWRDEHKAKALARRLQEEVDQLLEILLDMNEDQHLSDHRDLVLAGDPYALQVYKIANATKSLGEMLQQIPHTEDAPSDPNLLPPDLAGDKPPGFLDSTYEEEYLNNLDSQLGDDDATINLLAERGARPPLSRQVPTDKELQTSNPNSVISWLRRHHPETFIQDKDVNSEKAAAKPRGPGTSELEFVHTSFTSNSSDLGKRMSIAAQVTPHVKVDPDAADDDGTFGDDVAPRRGSAKRSKDDEPYRPKGGSSKKRKREDGDKPSSRSKKAKPAPAVDV